MKETTCPLSQENLRKNLAVVTLEVACKLVSVDVELREERKAVIILLFVLVAANVLKVQTGYFSK